MGLIRSQKVGQKLAGIESGLPSRKTESISPEEYPKGGGKSMSYCDVLVFLQNPWTKKRVFLGKPWDDETWERAMWESRSGIRLAQILPKRLSVKVRNANPLPTKHVTGLRRPDPIYVTAQIVNFSPKVLLLCGNEARSISTMGFNIPFVTMPHPAYRLLSGRHCDQIREQLQGMFPNEYPSAVASAVKA